MIAYQTTATSSSGMTRLVAVVDDLHRVEQLGQRDDEHDRGALHEPDHLVEGVGHDGAGGLRQDDAEEAHAAGQAECGRGLELSLVDREDARPDDLGRVGGLVQREADGCRGERADERDVVGNSTIQKSVVNGVPSPSCRVEVAEVVPDDDLHDERHRPEEPDVAPRRRVQQRRLRQPEHGEHRAEHEARDARDDRETERQPQAVDHRRCEEVLGEDVPLPLRVRRERPQELEDDERDDRRERPAAPVLDGHDAEAGVQAATCRTGLRCGIRRGIDRRRRLACRGVRLGRGCRRSCGMRRGLGSGGDDATHARTPSVTSDLSNAWMPICSGGSDVSKRGVYPLAR